MEYKQTELKKGIKLHTINNDKFKTNLIAVFLTTKLTRENVTKNAVISATLRRGSKTMPTQEEISKQMEEMYGASFDCGLDKTGDNQVLKFYLETINDTFLPTNGEDMLKNSLQRLLEIVLNPYTENESFKEQYVEQEKNNIKQRIEGKIDNKARYSKDRCIEEMYKEEPFGLYRIGYVEDLQKIDGKNLYEYYKQLINTCKIDIFVSGIVNDDIVSIVKENENITKLKDRTPDYIMPKELNKELPEKENIVTESMKVTQGKLIVGLNVSIDNEDLKYDALIYNSILGGSPNSKMFQNVREKAHLAYVASSSYMRYKNNIFINCGIEIGNYEKALKLIKKQIEDMRNGEFTEEDIDNAKKGIIATIKTIDDEQDTEITYYLGQELTDNRISIDDYMARIEKVTKQDILNIAKNVGIHTIYFLKD
ncbi:MAG: insulinase family protein [Clostridia bacterium]|nr:insulinase family protein [Clostridia bacterium]